MKKFVPDPVAKALLTKRSEVTGYLENMKKAFEASLEESQDPRVHEAANKGLSLVNETLDNLNTKS